MNMISWFLYLADVLSSVRILFGTVGVAAIIAGVFGWIAWTVASGSHAEYAKSRGEDDRYAAEWAGWVVTWDPLRGFLKLGCALVFVACILPTQPTMYAIAASQVGEQLVRNESVQGVAGDAAKALQQWIKRQIEPETKK